MASPNSIREVSLPIKKRGMNLFLFLLASADVAAGAPIAASLTREITQSCSLSYILLYSPGPFYFFFSFCVCLFRIT